MNKSLREIFERAGKDKVLSDMRYLAENGCWDIPDWSREVSEYLHIGHVSSSHACLVANEWLVDVLDRELTTARDELAREREASVPVARLRELAKEWRSVAKFGRRPMIEPVDQHYDERADEIDRLCNEVERSHG